MDHKHYIIKTLHCISICIAFAGAAVFILLSGFVNCSQRDIVILYICLCNFFVGMGEASGYSPNPVDIAPK